MKMILGPRTPKISTIEKKCQNHDRKSMGQNLKEMTTFLKSRQNQLSRNITFLKNRHGTQKKSLSESKTKLWTSIAKKSQKNYIKTLKYLQKCFCLRTIFLALLSNKKNTSVCSRYGQKIASRSKRTLERCQKVLMQ